MYRLVTTLLLFLINATILKLNNTYLFLHKMRNEALTSKSR